MPVKVEFTPEELDLSKQSTRELNPVEPFFSIKPWNQVKYLVFDIETTGLSPKHDKLLSIGVTHRQGNTTKSLLIKGDEVEMIDKFLSIVEKGKYDFLSGHNIFAFDLPFLIGRYQAHNYDFPAEISNRLSIITASSQNGNPIEFYDIKWPGVNLFDTFHAAGIYDKGACALSSLGLKVVPIELGLREPNDRPELSHQEIQDSFINNPALFDEYLQADLDDTVLLVERFAPVVWTQQAWVPKLSFQELAVASPAKKVNRVMEHLYPGRTPEPDEKIAYPGAISMAMKHGVHRHVAKLDVASLYPSIMLRYGVTSRKDTRGLFLDVLNSWRNLRLTLKAEGKKGNKQAAFEEGALKILINGSYGALGTGGYGFNDMSAAAKVTAYGREILTRMIDTCKANGGDVLSVDTDGLIFSSENAESLAEIIQAAMPPGIDLDLEYSNNFLCIPSVKVKDTIQPLAKNYIRIAPDGKMKITGKYKKRNCPQYLVKFVKEYTKTLCDSGEDAADLYYESVIDDIENQRFPINYFAETRKIPKSDKTFTELGLGKPGDKVSFWYTKQATYRHGRIVGYEKAYTNSEPYWPEHYKTQIQECKEGLLGKFSEQSPEQLPLLELLGG